MPSTPQPKRRQYSLEDGDISAVHYGQPGAPVRLVFLHANGFNALAYRELLQPLCADLNIQCIALDLPGHGMSNLPIDPSALRNFKGFADIVAEFLTRYVKTPILIGGHSLGAATSVLLASKYPKLVSGLVAFDPPTMPWYISIISYLPGGRNWLKKRIPIIRNAARRRTDFESLEAAFQRYQGRGTFRGFSDQALRDYLKGGLVPNGEGVTLACPPEWEQAVFAAQGQNIIKLAKRLPANSVFVYAGKDGPASQNSRDKMKKNLGPERYVFKPDFYHLFPLQEPDYARGVLKAMLKQIGRVQD